MRWKKCYYIAFLEMELKEVKEEEEGEKEVEDEGRRRALEEEEFAKLKKLIMIIWDERTRN